MSFRATFQNPALALSKTLPASPITTLNYCTSAKGQFDDTSPLEMRGAMSAYAAVCKDRSLALFFHGGLVDKPSALSSAQQLLGPYSRSGEPTSSNGNAYPYFFVWESGLFETLQQNLPRIVAETIFQRIRDIVGGKAQSVLSGAAAAQSKTVDTTAATLRAATLDVTIPPTESPKILSQADIDEVQQAVENDPLINAERQRIAQFAIPIKDMMAAAPEKGIGLLQASPVSMLSPEIVGAIAGEEALRAIKPPSNPDVKWNPLSLGSLALGAGKVLVRVIQRYATGRNHNFHNTVEEEIFRQFYVANIGWAIWNEMKQHTADAFAGDAQHNVGTAMIQELLKLYESGPDGTNARITLVGHSAGAVYICNFLSAMAEALHAKEYASAVKFDVILMAPAVRMDVMARTVSSYGKLIRHFRTFELSDAIEANEKLVQADNASAIVNAILAQIYTSSLLYFISGVLEDPDDDTPITGMRRFFSGQKPFDPGKFPAIDNVSDYCKAVRHSVIVSDTSSVNPPPPVGQRCTSYHHGGFPVDPATLQSVCYLLQTGDYS